MQQPDNRDWTHESHSEIPMIVPGLPQLPTDNLYKFQAVAGLAVFFMSAWLVVWLFWQQKLVEAHRAEQIISSQIAVTRLQRAVAEAEEAFAGSPDSALILKHVDRMDSLARASDVLIETAERSMARVNSFGPLPWVFGVAAAYLAIAGLYFSRKAFQNWYERHQKYQDRLIVAGTERAEYELAMLRETSPPKSVTDTPSPTGPFISEPPDDG